MTTGQGSWFLRCDSLILPESGGRFVISLVCRPSMRSFVLLLLWKFYLQGGSNVCKQLTFVSDLSC